MDSVYRDSSDQPKRKPTKRRAVICLETGIRYESATEASKALGINKSSISASVNRGCLALGHHFYYADEPMPPCSFFKRLTLKVRCNETGEVYDSARDAAKALGINPHLITGATEGQVCGYTWSYVTTDGAAIEFSKRIEDDRIAELQSALESEIKRFSDYKVQVARHIEILSKELDDLRKLR